MRGRLKVEWTGRKLPDREAGIDRGLKERFREERRERLRAIAGKGDVLLDRSCILGFNISVMASLYIKKKKKG